MLSIGYLISIHSLFILLLTIYLPCISLVLIINPISNYYSTISLVSNYCSIISLISKYHWIISDLPNNIRLPLNYQIITWLSLTYHKLSLYLQIIIGLSSIIQPLLWIITDYPIIYELSNYLWIIGSVPWFYLGRLFQMNNAGTGEICRGGGGSSVGIARHNEEHAQSTQDARRMLKKGRHQILMGGMALQALTVC